MSLPPRSRSAFTAIELVVVLAMAAIIVATSVPPVLGAIRRNAVSRSAEAIVSVAEEARRLARSPRADDLLRNPKGMYGISVVVPGNGQAYAVLLYGQGEGDVCTSSTTGQPLLRKYLNANVLPYTGAVSTGTGRRTYSKLGQGHVSWFYSRGSGRVVDYTPTGDGMPREVGTGDRQGLNLVESQNLSNVAMVIAPRPAEFGVVLLDGSYAVGLAFFHIGLGFSREIPAIVGR